MPETPWGELVLHTVLLRADSEYVYVHTHAYMHAHLCQCACSCMHIHVPHTYAHAHTHICTPMHLHTHTCVCTPTCAHPCPCTSLYLPPRHVPPHTGTTPQKQQCPCPQSSRGDSSRVKGKFGMPDVADGQRTAELRAGSSPKAWEWLREHPGPGRLWGKLAAAVIGAAVTQPSPPNVQPRASVTPL